MLCKLFGHKTKVNISYEAVEVLFILYKVKTTVCSRCLKTLSEEKERIV